MDESTGSGSELEPLHGLRLLTPRLELRLPTEDELVALARLAEQGVHPPRQMPFSVAWTDGIGGRASSTTSSRSTGRRARAGAPAAWHLLLGVSAAGELIGTQAIEATDFASTRTAGTGSWLGRRFQGRGFGTEMRAAVLELLFTGLDCQVATSSAIDGNVASERVSEKLGYGLAGVGIAAPRGMPVREQFFRLEREVWAARDRVPVELVGLEPCLPLFGL